MARGADSIERYIEVADIPPTTVNRTAAFLMRAKADLWPVSGKGGGKAAVHVEPHHVSNIVFAFAADQPSDAEAAVRLLRDTFLPDPNEGGSDG